MNCAVCGACFCVPDDETLIHLQQSALGSTPIQEEDVSWLRHMRIMGNFQAETDIATILSPETYWLSGPGRLRKDRVVFQRGHISGQPFRTPYSKRKGTPGPFEMLSLPLNAIDFTYLVYGFIDRGTGWRAAIAAMRPQISLIHEACFTIICIVVGFAPEEAHIWLVEHSKRAALLKAIFELQVGIKRKGCNNNEGTPGEGFAPPHMYWDRRDRVCGISCVVKSPSLFSFQSQCKHSFCCLLCIRRI
jgi:hypothetical protein